MKHDREMLHSFPTDSEGRPAGGQASGKGLLIQWQDGPLGRGEERKEPNGAFVETVIEVARDRLDFYQRSQFKCEENAVAIAHLTRALESLESRTEKREERGVEGTHES